MQNSKSIRIVVTGGAGFIGSHLVESLLDDYKVTIVDNLSTGRKKNVISTVKDKNLSVVVRDVSELSIRDLRDVRCIFHLAAKSDVKESMENPKHYFENNVMSTANLLETMRKSDVSRIVFASSSVVYGQSNVKHTEGSVTNPVSIYGTTKLLCESLIESYCKLYGFTAVILRLANIVGHRSSKGIIRDMIAKFKKNSKTILVLGDGKQTKSYLHVDDCVNAFLKCYKNMEKQSKPCEIYNVSNSDFVTVNKVVQYVGDVLHKQDYAIRYQKHDPSGAGWRGDITRAKLDISKLEQIGWRPRYDSMDAIKITVNNILLSM